MAQKWEPRAENESIDRDLIFQTLDWHCDDVKDTDGEGYGSGNYTIYTFGVDLDGAPVSLKIEGFAPFFYIEVPTAWDSTCVYSVKEAIGIKSVKKWEFLERKKYYGFENNKIRKFIKLSFWSQRTMNYVKRTIDSTVYTIDNKDYHFGMYESNIDPILRFTHIRDILTAGWVSIPQGKFKYNLETSTFECGWEAIKAYTLAANKIANFRVLYFDIEACSEDGSFPNALRKNDCVTQICCITKDQSGEIKKYLFNFGTIDPIDDTIVLQYPSEKKLLLGYAQFINEINPDIIVGYNIFGFDNGYLFERAKVLKIEGTFNCQSKIEHFTDIKKKVLDNQQSGFNEWKMTKFVGRIHIDLLQVIKKDFKLDSYKLNNVGEHFLGEGKDDVSPSEIFEAWSDRGTREKRTRVGKYCVQDTNLCLLLFEKFAVLANHIEMAKVTRVPFEYLITRGQSIKVFSQIAYETRKAGYLIPVLPKEESTGKFQGATVLEAKVGYYNRPVCGLDFASLYPSIMIAHNLDYSTVVLDPKYLGLPSVEYSTIDCGVDKSFTFVQSQKGVLTGILENLWATRKVTKKEMNAATDPFVKTVLNAKQLAIKVSMNSIYGFTGATVGALPCLEISQSVTAYGRKMIEQTSRIAKEQFCCEIIYGDSVTSDTPVLIRKSDMVSTIEIQELFKMNESKEYPQFKVGEPGLFNKEQSVPQQLIEIWTASGWSPLQRTIRHYCNKKIYRVITHTGIVDVTEDHSLLNENLEQIKPNELCDQTKLFHSFPDIVLNEEPYKLLNNYSTRSKIYMQSLYIKGRLNNYQVEIKVDETGRYYITYYFKNEKDCNSKTELIRVIDLGTTSGYVYDLETEDGTFQAGIGQMIVKNTDSCYVIFPDPVDADGSLTTLFKKAELAAAEISKTFVKPVELEFEKFMYPLALIAKKRYIYLEWTKPDKHNGEIEAKGVELVRRDNCPYVKDTLNAILHPIMFENNPIQGRIEAENHIDMLLTGKVPIKKLIISKNLRNEYAGYTKVYALKLADGRPDTTGPYVWIHTKTDRKTGITKQIEENPTMGQVALVEKMRKRDINSAPKPGDRVPFVYIDIKNPKALSWEKTEDPDYVIENKVPIDALYYLEHQLRSPIETIFNILIGEDECKKMFNDRKSFIDAKKQERETIGDHKRIIGKNKDIRSFFGAKSS